MIRPYHPRDRDALLAVWAASAAVAHPFATPAMFERERREIAEQFLPVAETYVVERGGVVVGFISLLGNEVGGIFVHPRYHGQGIGRALMDRARGSRDHLELDVFEANAIGRAFYAAYGFSVVGERLDETTGQHVLRLRLPSRPWSRVAVADYRARALRAHHYLADVPVYDAWRVLLPGDRPGTMPEVRATIRAAAAAGRASLPVRALFALRRVMGRALRWDGGPSDPDRWSWRRRLAADDLARSLVPPGTLDGAFAVLYVHPTEAVSEIRNATVQAFVVFAIEPAPGGHALLIAIHVLPVSAWTRPYLALIKPFRHWIVYPSLLRQLHDAWVRGLGAAGPEAK